MADRRASLDGESVATIADLVRASLAPQPPRTSVHTVNRATHDR